MRSQNAVVSSKSRCEIGHKRLVIDSILRGRLNSLTKDVNSVPKTTCDKYIIMILLM